ncbi:MAG: type I restriction enzyme HsdR N-terminal domain-containing protein [Cytophagaceae bacterium]|jgi:hypothetical protein|nr:type I restriction enzyme HsdR N-terminal domain-containing protein [Cytophagaceae bacterium]
MYPDLNLPPATLSLQRKEERIYVRDIVRKKDILLTPEEWVRQHMIHFLVYHLHYPLSMLSVERGLQYHERQKRTDIRLYENTGKVFMLIECKSTDVPITIDAALQLSSYQQTVEARYIVLTNGLDHIILKKNDTREAAAPWSSCTTFPDYQRPN